MREPLILNLFCHPIKFIWRFFLLYFLIEIPVSWVTWLWSFIGFTKFGHIVYIILIAYLALRWVRSSVESDYAEAAKQRNISWEEQKAQYDRQEAYWDEVRRKQQIYEAMQEEAQRRENAEAMRMYNEVNARWANSQEEYDYYKNQAESWRRMK